jgi:hypothetical protein
MLIFAALAAADTGSAPCAELSYSEDSCQPGDTVEITVTDCADGAWEDETFSVTADVGTVLTGVVGEDGVYRTTWTCPDVDCPGEEVGIYATVVDAEGAEDWAFGGIYAECEAADSGTGEDEESPCGCGGAGAWLLALPVAFGRRRRR